MVIKQIKCPPKGNSKYGIPVMINKWLPSMESYIIDYIGLGGLTGSTSNKEAKKAALGYNKFVKIDGKCGVTSDLGCSGKDKYMYMKGYPLGYLPVCKTKYGKHKNTGKYFLMGNTGLIGNIQEDLYNLNVSDAMKSMVGSGPFKSNDCMKARLPVGDSLLLGGRRFDTAEKVKQNGRGWYVEERCIPRQPTLEKQYGGEIFKIPFSASYCVREKGDEKEKKENFIVSQQSLQSIEELAKEKDLARVLFIISVLLVLGLVVVRR